MDLEPDGSPSAPEPELPSPPMQPRSPLRAIVAGVLALSLAVNGWLASRLRDQQDQTAGITAQLAQTRKSLADLQGSLRTGPGDAIERLENAVARIRGLKFRNDVPTEILSPAEFEERVRREFIASNPRARTKANQQVLATLGVIPATMDLFDFLQKLQEEQLAGFYDTKTRKLVVRANDVTSPSPLTRVFLAHELTHALTAQYHDLEQLEKLQDEAKDDEAEAFLALAEGDAQLVMQIYTREVLTLDEQAQLQEEYAQISQALYDSAPKFIQDELGFPYTDGLDFVTTLRDREGFERVDKAYADPPTSTEQILHPARYLDSRDAPTTVRLPDITASLGTGWKQISRGGFGELDLRALGDYGGGQGLTTQEARSAAEGWDGGRYVAAGRGEDTVVAVQCVFDFPSEARDAYDAFKRWLPLRYANVGSAFSVGTGTGTGWDSGKGAGAVLFSGSAMLLILGPDTQSVTAARRAFKGF